MTAGIGRLLHDLEPDRMDADDAVEWLDFFIDLERMGAAGKALLMKRVDDTGYWKRDGHRSAGHFLAARSGVGIGQAISVVETSHRLAGLSATEEALRAGRLSEEQAREVTTAAIEAPHAERDLLDRAHEDTYVGLKQHAAQVKANATSAEQERERNERIHRTRHVRFYRDRDGAGCGQWKLTPEADARLRAALRAEQEEIFDQARAEGRREPQEAYAADALLAMADRSLDGSHGGCGSRAPTALLRLDVSAARRGTTCGDEVCEIAGVGPISVDTARAMLPGALLRLVLTDGVDVLNVTTIGRHRTAAMEAALDWLHPECGVFGCHQHEHLEDHHTEAYRDTRHTKLRELVRLCCQHHDLVTHRHFTLQKRPDGQYDLIPPDTGADERGPP